MSRIDNLIREYCPDGVAFLPLAELLDYEQPTKYLVQTTNYNDSFSTPVLTAGQTFVLGRTDEVQGIYPASPETPVIIFDDFTTSFKWVDFPFKAKSSAMKMLTSRDETFTNQKYVYYVMQTIRFAPKDHARHWIATYSRFRVPVPPLEVQREIVRILDGFTALEAELEAELEARRKQYEHYKHRLLQEIRTKAAKVPLGRIADLNWGDTNTTKSSYVADGFLAYSAAGPDGYLDHYDYDRPAVVLSAIGALAGRTWRASGQWSCIKNTIRLFPRDENEVTTDYLYWITSTYGFWPLRGSAQPFIAKTDADKLLVPLPDIASQRHLTETLDAFDALVNDISIGLPAEIAARRKQYEHYRDKLLTFKELTP